MSLDVTGAAISVHADGFNPNTGFAARDLPGATSASSAGLTGAEARLRLVAQGPNCLPEPPRPSEIMRFLRQLASPLVLTLLAAAAVALAVGLNQGGAGQSKLFRFGDAAAITLIVLLNAILGYLQERRAQTAIDALRRMETPMARVRRDGAVTVIPASELVTGDLFEIEAGDAVPADARLLKASDFAAEESALTGESVPVAKKAGPGSGSNAPLALSGGQGSKPA